jgi:acyl-coenzyme A thioesterase PaaI-like protein
VVAVVPGVALSSTTMVLKLSQLLAQAEGQRGALAVTVPEDWMQGRSVFGGLQAALALRAMRGLVPEAPLRTLQVTFVAPTSGTLNVRAEVLRAGKNATHVEARIGDGDATQALVVGVFGTARSSAVARLPRALAIDASKPPLYERGFGGGPSFTSHFQVRWHRGERPFSGAGASTQILDVALDDDGPMSEAQLLTIADFMPPIAFSLLSAPVAGSTLTWMLELLIDRVDLLPTSGLRIEAEMIAARDGYTNQAVRLFGPAGEPVALSHQTMLVFG